MNLNVLAGWPCLGAWNTFWYASQFQLPCILIPKSKRRRPSLVLGGPLPASLLGLGLLVLPLLAQTGPPPLADPFQNVDTAALRRAAAEAHAKAPKAVAHSHCPDQDLLTVPLTRPSTTALQPDTGSNVASPPAHVRGPSGERCRRNETTLEIAADGFPDAAIRGLLDDWIIPMIVEDIIQVQSNEARPDDH
jgi:hypothetical protein